MMKARILRNGPSRGYCEPYLGTTHSPKRVRVLRVRCGPTQGYCVPWTEFVPKPVLVEVLREDPLRGACVSPGTTALRKMIQERRRRFREGLRQCGVSEDVIDAMTWKAFRLIQDHPS